MFVCILLWDLAISGWTKIQKLEIFQRLIIASLFQSIRVSSIFVCSGNIGLWIKHFNLKATLAPSAFPESTFLLHQCFVEYLFAPSCLLPIFLSDFGFILNSVKHQMYIDFQNVQKSIMCPKKQNIDFAEFSVFICT